MSKLTTQQNSFAGGVLSHELFGRTDFGKYFTSVEQADNVIIQPTGPLRRRNGMRYVDNASSNTDNIRLLPFFVAGNEDNIILEFKDLLITPFNYDSNDDPQKIAATTVVTPYLESELDDLDFVQFANEMYIVHPDHDPRILTRTSDTVWALSVLDTRPPPTVELGYNPSQTLTLGATSGLGVTATAGAASFLIADIGRQIVNLNGNGRASITAFTSTTVVTVDILETFDSTSISSGDWKLDLSPIVEVTPDGQIIGSIITLTADGVLNAWRSTDVGRYVHIHNGIVEITEYTSALIIKGVVLKTLDDIVATEIWSIEDPSWSSSRGFPRAIAFYQGRVWLGGSATEPSTVWASRINDFKDFGRGASDDDPLSIDINLDYTDKIQWIAGTRDLFVGTESGEVTIQGNNSTITPSNQTQNQRTANGSPHIKAQKLGSEIFYVDISKRKLRSTFFSFQQDTYTSADLIMFAKDSVQSDITAVAVSKSPDPIIWVLKADGDLVSISYDKSQDILGVTNIQTEGDIESISVIQHKDRDNLWMIVRRDINGSSVKYVETLVHGANNNDLSSFQDSYLTLSVPLTISGITQASPGVVTSTGHLLTNGDRIRIKDVVGMAELNGNQYKVANTTANTFELTTIQGANVDTTGFTAYQSSGVVYEMVTAVTGLTHLEGETVQVRGDGAILKDQVVVSGGITLDTAAGEVVVGLPYSTTIKTLSHQQQGAPSSTQGQPKRWIEPILRVYRSANPTVNGEVRPIRFPSDPMGAKTGLSTGDLVYSTKSFSSGGQLTIVQSNALPLELQALFGIMEINVR